MRWPCSLPAENFVDDFAASFGKAIESISPESVRALQHYAWPGNVHQLRNVIERAMILATGPRLDVPLPKPSVQMPRATSLSDVQGEHIRTILESTNWRRARGRWRRGAARRQTDHAREPHGEARHRAQRR